LSRVYSEKAVKTTCRETNTGGGRAVTMPGRFTCAARPIPLTEGMNYPWPGELSLGIYNKVSVSIGF